MAKRGVVVGLLGAAAVAMFYLLSFGFSGSPLISVVARGAARFIITVPAKWGAGARSFEHTRRVAWVESVVLAAFAIGAFAGSALYAGYGLASISRADGPPEVSIDPVLSARIR